MNFIVVMMGSRKEHEELLEEVLTEFRKRGLKVISLKRHPDGLLVIDNKLIGIEVTSGKHDKPFQRKKRYKNSELDEVIIIGKTAMKEYGLDKYTPAEAYSLALKLRNQGLKYKDIKKIIEGKFSINICVSTICHWCLGHSKPYLARNLEG